MAAVAGENGLGNRPWRTAFEPAPEPGVFFREWASVNKGPLAVSRSAARRASLLGHRELQPIVGEPWFAPGGPQQVMPRLQDPRYERPGPARDN